MIILWIRAALLFLARLIIPAPASRDRIDLHVPCPACGHPSEDIRAVVRKSEVFIKHACGTCGALWYEKPIRDDYKIDVSIEG